eukprot:scaffold49868_cov57-Phaeocystis_antarctica.AAC.5
MNPMSVTLDVSKLSSWLNAVASCRLAHVCDCRDAPARDGAVRRLGGRHVGIVGFDRCPQGGLGCECGRAGPWSPARAIAGRRKGRGARPCATDEELDCVGQRVRSLPSRKGSIGSGATCRPRGGRAWGDRGASSMQGRLNCGGCWQGHARSARQTCSPCSSRWTCRSSAAGRTPTRSVDSKGKDRMRSAMQAGRRERVGRRRKQSVQGGRNYGGCRQGTRGAHPEHLVHACDAGRVEAQRLVEHRRPLPRPKGSIGSGATCGAGGGRAWGGGGASSAQGGRNC